MKSGSEKRDVDNWPIVGREKNIIFSQKRG
jgi:hypothetical protein